MNERMENQKLYQMFDSWPSQQRIHPAVQITPARDVYDPTHVR